MYPDLLEKEGWPNAHLVEAKVSRIVIDVERGVLYECDHRGHPIRYVITSEKREKLLNDFYYPHWEELRAIAKIRLKLIYTLTN